jgi:hypothetical protein
MAWIWLNFESSSISCKTDYLVILSDLNSSNRFLFAQAKVLGNHSNLICKMQILVQIQKDLCQLKSNQEPRNGVFLLPSLEAAHVGINLCFTLK